MMTRIPTHVRSSNSTKYNMTFIFRTSACLAILVIGGIVIVMASTSSDVDHLRQQYQKGKNRKDQLIIQYNNRPFQDGDELKKSDTQTKPNVQINVETDPQNPYLTLVNISLRLLEMSMVFSLDYGRSRCTTTRK